VAREALHDSANANYDYIIGSTSNSFSTALLLSGAAALCRSIFNPSKRYQAASDGGTQRAQASPRGRW